MKKVINQFSTRAKTYSASANWIADQALIQAHIDAAAIKPCGALLEICCGTGMVGRNLINRRLAGLRGRPDPGHGRRGKSIFSLHLHSGRKHPLSRL